jgi:GR25 family glycosyltransferase involved in LPS biosynthesis
VVEKVYVIHCRRLAARREYLQPILRDLGWDARWIDTYDPGDIPRRHLLGFRWGAPMLTVAEISVYLKHLEVFRRIRESGAPFGFVIEDDTVFPAGDPAALARCWSALPAPFDLIFFGASCGFGESSGEGEPKFTRQLSTRSLSGYLITASACHQLLAELEDRPICEPIDLAVNRTIRARRLDVWWSEPPLLLNGSETGTFEHSLGLPWREGTGRPGLSARLRRVFDRIAAAITAPG